MGTLWNIFITFFRISLCAFGGGYASLALLEKELVDARGWLDETELTDLYALAQCMPGLILINMAVLIVCPRFGRLAAVAAVAGLIVPPLIIVTVIAALLTNYAQVPAVRHALAGIRVTVSALLCWCAWRLIRTGVRDLVSVVIFAVVTVVFFFDWIPVIPVILLSAAAGLLIGWIRRRQGGVDK